MRRLSKAGFRGEFVEPAILPDWWNASCADDDSVLPDIELRVARFLGVSVSEVRNPKLGLKAPQYEGAQLRRVHDVDRDRLAPAIHSALQIAGAAVRSLRNPGAPVEVPPKNALTWREQISRSGKVLTLDDLVGDLWARGIPVIPVGVLPRPSFQGVACIVEGRPVILLGHKNDEPGRIAFVVSHEIGHVVAGDCSPGIPVVDEADEVPDDSYMEKRADRYATRVVVGDDTIPTVDANAYKELAKRAFELEQSTGANASAVIFSWARRTNDYMTATMALKALYRTGNARETLRQHFERNVDLETATETDRSLLRCVYGDALNGPSS
jgi:Zn-dependent peptidase ImmA (M78 family)